MKLEAKTRLKELSALLKFPARNDSQRGYLAVIANMITGDRPIGKDYRSWVARYLVHHPNMNGRILLIGHKDTGDIYHCLLVDQNSKIVADAMHGQYADNIYSHRANQEWISSPAVAEIQVKDFVHHLVNGTFANWATQFPN